MKLDVQTLAAKKDGSVDLPDAVFGLEVRRDLLHRMVSYQLAKRRAGTNQVQERGDVRGSGAKQGNQKGGGRARHGNKKVPQYRGGGKAFGPRLRDHSTGMPKKVRALALRHALSAKASAGELIVLSDTEMKAPKTKDLKTSLGKLGLEHVLVIDGAEVSKNFALASRNIINLDVLPVQGINVYDILRRRKLVLTKSAVEALEARFK
jgi:large subunit ribosomal protein L4